MYHIKHWTQYGHMSQESNLQFLLLSLPFKPAPGNFTWQQAAWNLTSEYLKILWCNVSKMHTAPSCLPSQLVWDHFLPQGEETEKILCNWVQIFWIDSYLLSRVFDNLMFLLVNYQKYIVCGKVFLDSYMLQTLPQYCKQKSYNTVCNFWESS